MPDFPVRLTDQVVRYLEFFRRDPRGQRAVATWYRASGATSQWFVGSCASTASLKT